jgi:hypothetical protein
LFLSLKSFRNKQKKRSKMLLFFIIFSGRMIRLACPHRVDRFVVVDAYRVLDCCLFAGGVPPVGDELLFVPDFFFVVVELQERLPEGYFVVDKLFWRPRDDHSTCHEPSLPGKPVRGDNAPSMDASMDDKQPSKPVSRVSNTVDNTSISREKPREHKPGHTHI